MGIGSRKDVGQARLVAAGSGMAGAGVGSRAKTLIYFLF